MFTRFRPRSVVAPADVVAALKDLYASAMEGPRERFEGRLSAPPLTRHESRELLPPIQAIILATALRGVHRRELENSEREDLIERAASGRLGTYIDVDYARRLLGTAGWQSALTDPDVRDHLEYVGRVMPTISILTALAFREQATRIPPWRSRVDTAVMLYERRLDKALKRRRATSTGA